MKKTLVAVLGLSSFVIASGKVELINETKNTVVKPSSEPNKKADFFKEHDLETTHKLKANIKENNVLAEVELGTTGKLEKKANGGAGQQEFEYKFGKSVTGFIKAGYDNGTLAGSVKYNFTDAETFADASYKYTDGKLTLKPKAELKLEVLNPAKVTVSNETTYKFNDMFTVKNTSNLYSSIKGMKGEVVAPEFLENNKIKGTIKLFGLNTKAGLEYRASDEVKLTGNLYAGFEKSAIELPKYKGKTEVEELKADQKVYEVKVDGKADFTSNTVKGLKSDFRLNYGFKNTIDHAKTKTTADKEPTIVSNRHSFGLDSNTSYLVDLTNGFSLTPALNLKYEGSLTNFVGVEKDVKATATLKENKFTVKPSAKLGYKYDKFTASLNLETPFEFSNKKYEKVEKKEMLTNVNGHIKLNNGVHDFKFNKGTLKTTLSLGYSW